MASSALASRAQDDDIGKLNHSIERIDSDTQQNTARVAEAAAVAAGLREQVGGLLNAVSTFTLETAPPRSTPILSSDVDSAAQLPDDLRCAA